LFSPCFPSSHPAIFYVFFFYAPASSEIYTLSLHDALPIWKSNPQILKRLLRVIIQRPLNILAQPGTPPLQNLTNGRQLVIGNVSNPQIPNVLTSPRRHLPLQSPLEKRLTASRVTFSSLRRVMRQRHSIQQCHGLALNLGIPTETASRANLPADSALGLKVKIGLPRMRHLTLSHRTIQHR